MQLQNYAASQWVAGSGKQSDLIDSITGELIGTTSSGGSDFGAMLKNGREATGRILRIFDQTADFMLNRLSCLFTLLVSAGAFAQPGTLDQSYGAGGWAIHPLGGQYCEGRAIALAADGSSYVVGACNANPDIRVAHLDVNGQLDTDYGTDGIATIDIDPGSMADPARGAAVQQDGKLLIAGSTYSFGTGDAFTLVRLLPDGSLDSTFATNGVLLLDFSNNDDQANGMLLLASGKILLYGRKDVGGPNPLVVRLNADGTLDNTSRIQLINAIG